MDTPFACPLLGSTKEISALTYSPRSTFHSIWWNAYQRASQLAVAQPPPFLSSRTGKYL